MSKKAGPLTVPDLEKYVEVHARLHGLPKTELWPDNEKQARRMVGMFMRLLGKPAFKKWGDTSIEASFTLGKHKFVVNRYQPKTCKMVLKRVKVPARPAVPAVEEHYEMRQVLECETEIKGE